MDDVVRTYVPAESVEEQWDLQASRRCWRKSGSVDVVLAALVDEERFGRPTKTSSSRCRSAADELFDSKVARVGVEQFTPFERMILLQSIDQHWREHLAALDYLRQGIHLRGYAQKNPKQEYKREAFELFSQMLDIVKMDVTRILMSVRVQSEEEVREAALAIEERAEHIGNVTYTHPNDDGSVSEERGSETAARRRGGDGSESAAAPAGDGRGGGGDGVVARGSGAQGGAQRPLPLREREEVQAVPRQAGVGRPGAGGQGARRAGGEERSHRQRLRGPAARQLPRQDPQGGAEDASLPRHPLRRGPRQQGPRRGRHPARPRRRGADPADAHRRARRRAGRAGARIPGRLRGRASHRDGQARRRSPSHGGSGIQSGGVIEQLRSRAARGPVPRAGAPPRPGDLRPPARRQDSARPWSRCRPACARAAPSGRIRQDAIAALVKG